MHEHDAPRWVLCAALLLAGGNAGAAAYAFDGGAVGGCTLAAMTYSCAPNPSSANDDVSVGAGYIIAGNLLASTVTVAQNGAITGSVSSTTTITLAAGAYIGGSMAAGTTATLAAGAHINGSASTGTTLTLAAGAYVSGSAAAGTSATLAADAYVGGDLSAQTAVTMGANARVGGNLTAGTAVTMASGACVGGVVRSATLTSVGPPSCGVPPANGPHHLLLSHSGAGLTCAPQTVSVTACANAACTAPHFSAGLTVTLTPGSQSFPIDASGVNATATVRQSTAGTATLAALASPAALNPTLCHDTTRGTASCAMQFADAGFVFSVPNHVAESQQTFSVRAVKKSDASQTCVPAYANTTKRLNFRCAYVNPASGTVPLRLGGNVALAASAAAACSAAGADFTLTFDASGSAPVTLLYADVGKMLLSATLLADAADAGLLMDGSSVFIAAPAGFGIGAIAQLAAPGQANPAAPDAGGGAFIQAGAAFSATITALNARGVTSANFGNESPPETLALVDTTQAPGAATYANHASLVAPVGGANPALTATAGPFQNGAATASLSWSEVGIIKLHVILANGYGYLGQAGAASGFFPGGASANIGRFIPAYFNTAVGAGIPMPCPAGLACPAPGKSFVYSAQAFGVQVTAFNLAGAITANYDSASGFARLVALTAWDAAGATVTQNPPLAPSGSAMTNAALASFTLGVGSGMPAYRFPAAYPAVRNLGAPTAIFLRAGDSDAVTSARASASIEGGVLVIGRRLQLENNYGSELLATPLSLTVQYWNGRRYVTSDTDSASVIARTDVVLGNCLKHLSAAGAICKSALAVSAAPAAATASAGLARFRLDAAGAGNDGSVDISVRAPAWLPSTTARVVLGIYKSPNIYARELY